MMTLFHIHDWTPWEDYHQTMRLNRSGAIYTVNAQKRRCRKCKRIDTREV